MRVQHIILAFALGLGGCALHGSGSSSGNPELQFDNCSSDCGLDQNSVAAGGAHTTILVNGGVHFVSAQSSNPAVAKFTADGAGKVDVESGAPGSAELELLDAADQIVANGTVTVVATAQLRPNRGWDNGAAPLVLEGETMTSTSPRSTRAARSPRATARSTSRSRACSSRPSRSSTATPSPSPAPPAVAVSTPPAPSTALTQGIEVVPALWRSPRSTMTQQLQPND